MSMPTTTSRGGFPWIGGLVALISVLVMVAASIWAWPLFADGFEATQRNGTVRTVTAWPLAGLMPALLAVVAVAVVVAQPVRRRVARAAQVPVWRTDQTNRWSTSMSLIAVSLAFLGVHGLLLSLVAGWGVSLGLAILAFCLGLMVMVLGNYLGKLAPLTDEQRAFFPAPAHGFIDCYRDGFHRTARRLVWPFIGVGALTCALAFFVPLVAVFVPTLAALTLCIPIGYGIFAGLMHRDDSAAG